MFCLFKRKKLIDRELAVYKTEQLVKIDKQISDYRTQRQLELTELGKQCHEQIAQYEHEFHSTKETRGIELAKLQAEVKAWEKVLQSSEETAQANNNLLKSKEAEIQRLNEIIKQLINKQPTTIIQQPQVSK